MKVIAVPELVARIRCRRAGKKFLFAFLGECQIAEAIIIRHKATKGDVILSTGLFEVVEKLNDGIFVYVKPKGTNLQVIAYSKEWWDEPYEVGE